MTDGDALSPERAQERYAEERRQGAALLQEGFESAWGWSGPAGRERAGRRAAFLIEAAALGPGVRCLELGCGTGEFTHRLAKSGCELTAVELSGDTAARARERVGNAAEIVIGNIETGEGLEGRTFDAVVGVSVLHHVDLTACLDRVTAALRDGGRFAFSEPNMANPQVWAERRFASLRRRSHTTQHETAFRRRRLRANLEAAGLQVEVCEPFDFLHPSVPGPLVGLGSRIGDLLERTPVRAIAGSLKVAGSRPPVTTSRACGSR